MKIPALARSSRKGRRVALVTLVLSLVLGGAGLHALRGRDAGPRGRANEPSGEASGSAATAAGAGRAGSTRFDRARGPGIRHTYATRFDQDVALSGGAEGGGRAANALVRIRVTGDLDLAFVGHDGGKHRLFAELANARVTIGEGGSSPRTEALERELRRPFWVLAEEDGRVRRYVFARDLSPTAQNVLRGLLGSAQVAVRDEAAWTADEDDIQGSYVASYSRDEAGAIVKTKRPYAKVEGMETLEVRARGVASVGDDGWPTKVSFEEHKVASMGVNMPVATTDARLELAQTGTRLDASLLGLYEREAEALVETGPFGTGDDAEASRAADARLVGDATADTILADARAARDDAAMIAAGDRLAARLRLTPDEADRMARLARSLPAREGNVVVSALGGAETPESARALGRLANDPKAVPALRANAATQLAFAKGANAVEARDSLSQGLDDPSREVRESSALSLGNVARELGDEGAESVAELVARYERAGDDEERAMLLDALGNSGSVAILPVVRAALASENEALRAAASGALRFLPIGEADTLLSRVLGAEPSPTVLVAAIDAIGFRIVEMHARALERVVLADSAGRVRAAVSEIVLRALSTRKGTLSADARAALSALLEKARASG